MEYNPHKSTEHVIRHCDLKRKLFLSVQWSNINFTILFLLFLRELKIGDKALDQELF